MHREEEQETGLDVVYSPVFLNNILGAIKSDVSSPNEEIKKYLKDKTDSEKGFDWRKGLTAAVSYTVGLVSLLLSKNPKLKPAEVEELLCKNAAGRGNKTGTDRERDHEIGCGYLLPWIGFPGLQSTTIDYVSVYPPYINLGNYYDPDNQKPLKVTIKNIGGGSLKGITKENIIFRTPFKKTTVRIDDEKSWLKVIDIKTIEHSQAYDIIFIFDRNSINKSVINKNPDKVFVGELIIVPDGVKDEIRIPVDLYGGRDIFENVKSPIYIFVYEKDEYETKEEPKAIYESVADGNLEFEIPQLNEEKEYVVIATTRKDWYKEKGNFFIGQGFLGKDKISGSLEIHLYKTP